MMNFEKQKTQKQVYYGSLVKEQLFSGTVSIRLFKFNFAGKIVQKESLNNGKFRVCVQSAEQKNQILAGRKMKLKSNFIQKKLLNGYSKIHELKLVTIGLASPEKIQSWAEKELPNGKTFGEVTNANTFHYRTFKPSKGGLFCERIFGPIKDFECACGKRQKPTALESRKILEHEQTSRYFCPNCDVEYTWSIIRRYQLGYIKLNAPVTHLWYFKTNPSYLSILFDIKRKHLESIIYCTETITIENTWKYSFKNYSLNRSPTDLYLTWQKFFKMEEKLKKNQIVYENKHEEQKKNKIDFRNLYLTQNILQNQMNWQKFDQKNFLMNRMNEEFSKTHSVENLNTSSKIVSTTKTDILVNISKQKQKKVFSFLFQEIWKKFLQKSYRNAFIYMNSQKCFAEQFFQKFGKIFIIFLFCSKKNKKFYTLNDNSLVLDLTFLGEKNLFDLDTTVGAVHFSNTKNQFTNSKNSETFEKKKIKKIFWKSLFFLFEFGSFFSQQKNKKMRIYKSFSKKDYIFLINLLPFLKQILFLKNLKFSKKNYKKIQSFLLENISKKNRIEKNSKYLQKSLLTTKIQFELQSDFTKVRNFFIESNFSFFNQKKLNELIGFTGEKNSAEKISLFSDKTIVFRANEKNGLISFNQFLKFSGNFEKNVSVWKSYYEINFCSYFQKKFSDFEKNVFLKKNMNQQEWESFSLQTADIFFQESKVFCTLEKVSFEYFSLFLYFENNKISGLNIDFPKFFIISKNFTDKKFFSFHNFKVQPSLFFLFKFFPLLFFSISLSEKNLQKNTMEKKLLETKYPLQNEKRGKIRIYNKPLLSKVKLNQKQKQLQNDKLHKFFHFDYFADDFSSYSSKENSKILPGKLSKSSISFTKSKKKSVPVFSEMQKKIFHNKTVQKKQQNLGILQMKMKEKTNENRNFLKNIVSTIAYNYPWNNDADWKYFVYYNSLFFYEFEDIPIFIYRSFSPLKGAATSQALMISQTNWTSSKYNQSFFSWSMDSSPKNFFVGAGILEKLLTEYTSVELRKMTKQHQILLPKIHQTLRFLKQNAKTKKDFLNIQKYFQKREHIIRRLKFLRKFSRRNSNPSFMILKNLPVLPPDLRPILKLQNQIAASDLNRFYQRIIYRNDRLKKFYKDSATNQSFEIKYAQRLLQEAVDNLIQNGKGSVKAETNSRGQPLKSLSEILKGKQGRFRQYLLGKRVDYSGRSVIVVGPELKLYECGIPKEMAQELFLPFLIQHILQYKLAQTVVGAKNLLKADSSLTLHLLHKVMKNIPVLLNRAPTLHRLGFQAFLPKLIEGRAILLHPMVCPAFNADFDGDQMAVHIPLTVEARTEAWKFMLSINNLINSATGESIILPSQDMVLGCYYLTIDYQSKFVGIQISNLLRKQNFSTFLPFGFNQKVKTKQKIQLKLSPPNFQRTLKNKSFLFFKNFASVITSYQQKEISLHTPVWIKWNSKVDFGNDFSKPLEIRLQTNGSWEQIRPKYTAFYNNKNKQLYKCIRTTPGRILMNLMIQECIDA